MFFYKQDANKRNLSDVVSCEGRRLRQKEKQAVKGRNCRRSGSAAREENTPEREASREKA